MNADSENPQVPLGRRIARASTTTAIAHELLHYLRSGTFSPGERLPPENQLARDLGVSRSAVREALAALDMLGIIVTRQGSGSYFNSSTSELLPQAIEWGMLLGDRQLADLLEARAKIEVALAELAAAKRTDEEALTLEAIVLEMERAESDLSSPSERDLSFHAALSRMARNRVLADTLTSIQSLMRVQIWQRLHRTPEQAERSMREHRAIFEAVRNGDVPAAANAMATHMASVIARIEGDMAAELHEHDGSPR